jgi:hypothetical protein
MRTRYAVAVYLVVFGSIIVAAYKMGMVHEKPRVVTRNPLDADDIAAAAPTIDASTVLGSANARLLRMSSLAALRALLGSIASDSRCPSRPAPECIRETSW